MWKFPISLNPSLCTELTNTTTTYWAAFAAKNNKIFLLNWIHFFFKQDLMQLYQSIPNMRTIFMLQFMILLTLITRPTIARHDLVCPPCPPKELRKCPGVKRLEMQWNHYFITHLIFQFPNPEPCASGNYVTRTNTVNRCNYDPWRTPRVQCSKCSCNCQVSHFHHHIRCNRASFSLPLEILAFA